MTLYIDKNSLLSNIWIRLSPSVAMDLSGGSYYVGYCENDFCDDDFDEFFEAIEV